MQFYFFRSMNFIVLQQKKKIDLPLGKNLWRMLLIKNEKPKLNFKNHVNFINRFFMLTITNFYNLLSYFNTDLHSRMYSTSIRW